MAKRFVNVQRRCPCFEDLLAWHDAGIAEDGAELIEQGKGFGCCVIIIDGISGLKEGPMARLELSSCPGQWL